MRIDLLRARNLRCFETVEIAPGPVLNWFVGANGTGKTTLLEAAYLLSHGHSFRPGGREALASRGQSGYGVYAELRKERGDRHRVGLARATDQWQVRIDGESQATLAALLGCCAVVCFEPGSHALIAGAAEARRRFMDWGVFHVERDYLPHWRDYLRALRQRNALLRAHVSAGLFDPWEAELDRLASLIGTAREGYLDALAPLLSEMAADLLPELGSPRLSYRPGWDRDIGLAQQLSDQRGRDLQYGHTRMGPHRADWTLVFEHAPAREFFSRGQAKLAAMICVLGQAALCAKQTGEWPVICLDDLESELDPVHRNLVVARLVREPAQVWITSTRMPEPAGLDAAALFHVEQGRCERVAR